jgi:hypothetical protein
VAAEDGGAGAGWRQGAGGEMVAGEDTASPYRGWAEGGAGGGDAVRCCGDAARSRGRAGGAVAWTGLINRSWLGGAGIRPVCG